MPKIKSEVIILDKGNTLLMDPFEAVLSLKASHFKKAFDDQGVSVETQEINKEWTRSNGEINYPFIGHFWQEEPIIQNALVRLQVPAEIASLLGPELLKIYREGYKEVIKSDPRTKEVKLVLEELKERGKKLGVLSNDRDTALKMELQCMGIKQYFEYIETSESLFIEKPHPRAFDHVLTYFRVLPSMVTYVGDDPLRDIDQAKARGLNGVLYSVDAAKYNESWRSYEGKTKYKPDAIIKKLSELLEIIE